MKKRHFLSLACLLFLSCSQRDQLQPKQSNVWMVSESRELEIGAEVAKEIEREYPVYNDPELAAYTDRIGQALARVSDRNNIRYSFKVLDSPIANAFAAPGGYIYVTRGILAVVDSEAEFGGILGHEIGHVAARHGAKRMQAGTLAQIGFLAAVLLAGDKVDADVFRAADVAATLIFLGYSRSDEDQADILGAKYLYRAGYDRNGMVGAMEGLLELQERDPMKAEQFFQSHPLTRDRIEHIRSWMPRIPKEDVWGGIPPRTELQGVETYQRLAAPHAIYAGEDKMLATIENFRVGMTRRQIDLVEKTISASYRDEAGRDRAAFLRDQSNLFSGSDWIEYKISKQETEPRRDGGAAKFNFQIKFKDRNSGNVYHKAGRAYLEFEKPIPHVWKIKSIREVPLG